MSKRSILWQAALLAAVGCSPAQPTAQTPPPSDDEIQVASETDSAVSLVSLKVPNMH